jgi:hypothetical protein
MEKADLIFLRSTEEYDLYRRRVQETGGKMTAVRKSDRVRGFAQYVGGQLQLLMFMEPTKP